MTKFLAFILALAACTFPTGRRQADESTFKLTAKDIATGTAWVVAPHTLMTAGHMCEMPGPDATYFATDWNGRSVLAHPFLWEMSDSELADLCLLHTAAPLGRPLHLADDMPDVGTPVHYIGYPLGIYTASDGVYEGANASSAPCDHGASGSGMYSDEGVFGVLVQLRQDLKPGCLSVPIDEVRKFLTEAGVTPS